MIVAPPQRIIDLARPQLIAYFRALIQIRADPGTAITSWWRDQAVNAAVGGVRNSFHLWGLALDVVAPDPGHLVHEARRVGLEPIDFGSHVHIEPTGSPPPVQSLNASRA